MRAGYCKLSWDAPEDDGGTPISQYVVNMMDLTVNEWVAAAETKDKSAEVKCLKPGHLYRFEVFAVNKEGESPAARLKDPVKAENPYTTPGVPTDVCHMIASSGSSRGRVLRRLRREGGDFDDFGSDDG